ncbi:MAG: DEAD/DEAH box helicase [Candidatus Aenigmarchaeota archaeon]|nr:DEAD/DEAH box helicase [Candidatus Aenigmarchaeota archaeon]
MIEKLLELSGINSLNPVQKESVDAGVLNGENLVVSAPTASGKTLIAELAMLRCVLEKKKKTVYIVPLRALASEKYETFKEKYEKVGIKIAISIGDYDSSDSWLEKYDVIILTSEKFDSLLRRDISWISSIGLVVADEIHIIGDQNRGPTMEILLTKLKRLTKAQFIALSATIKNAREIANWLDAKVVESDYRPVKLYEGVYAEGKIGFYGKESVNLDGDELPEIKIVHDTAKKNKQSLVFMATRKSAEATAERISEYMNDKLSSTDTAELKKLSEEILNVLEYPTKQCERLAKCVKGGIAFHHAGLVSKQRKLIENGFRNNLIKAIAATPTLCLDGNTEIWNFMKRTRIEDTSKGMSLALKGNDVVEVPVQGINNLKSPKRMIKITTVSGNSITVTPNHEMMVKKQGKQALVQAGNCKKGGRIATVGNIPIVQFKNPKWSDFVIDHTLPFPDEELDKRTFYIIGLMLGDGYSGAETNNDRIKYKGSPSIVGRDALLFKEVKRLCNKRKIHYRETKNVYGVPQLVLSKSNWFREFLVRCGIDAGSKKYISLRLLSADRNLLKWLVKGLFDTDGWVEKRTKRVCFSNISVNLIKDVRMALLRYGIVTRARNREGKKLKMHRKIYYSKDSKELSINHSASIKNFFTKIGFLLERKNNKLKGVYNSLNKDLLKVACKKCKYTVHADVFGGRTKTQKIWGRQKRSIVMLLGREGSLTSRHVRARLNCSPFRREGRLDHHFAFISRNKEGNTKIWKLNRLGYYVYRNILLKKREIKNFFNKLHFCPFCKKILIKTLRKSWRENDFSGDIFWDIIKSVTTTKPSGKFVYDVILPEDGTNSHLFAANGFLVHNSMGINLPAYRVVIRDAKRFYALTGWSYIPVLDYQQMCGRAGRPQFDTHGESILIAKSLNEGEDLAERYIMGETEEIYSKLASEPVLRVQILALIATETCNSIQSVYDFFSRTFYGLQYGSSSELAEKIDAIIDFLKGQRFVEQLDDKLRATVIGKRVSELYIDPDTAVKIIAGLKNSKGAQVDSSALIELLTTALEMRPYLNVRQREFNDLYEKISSAELLHEMPDEWDYDYEESLKSFKTALMACDWMNEATEEQIFEIYGLTPGELHNKISILDWLFYSAQEIAILLGAKEIIKDLRKTRVRIVYGIKEELLPLVKLRDIGRFRARRLFNAGFVSIEKLREAPEITIATLLGPNVAKSVKRQLSGKEDEKNFEAKGLMEFTQE